MKNFISSCCWCFLLFSLLLLTLFSCGKEASVGKLSINIEIPKNVKILKRLSPQQKSLVNGEVIVYVVLNVSGPGMAPLFWNWEAHNRVNNALADAPASIDLLVPSGTPRLVQALIVTESSDSSGLQSNNAMTFYYGDVSTSISGATTVSVTATLAGRANNSIDFSGRYLTSDQSGPTGHIEVLMNPPNGSPPMRIEETYIASGWFNFFAIDTVPFSYRIKESGEYIFQQITSSSPLFASSERVMKINIPYMTYKYFYNGTATTSNQGDSGAFIFGFWGPGSSGKVICYKDSNGDYVHRFLDSISGNTGGLFNAQNQSVRWYNNYVADHLSRLSGGIGLSQNPSACASSNAYSSNLLFNYKKFKNGRYSAIGINPPFTIPLLSELYSNDKQEGDLFSRFLTFDYQPSGDRKLRLRWRYLPGTQSFISGMDLYYKPGAGNNTNSGPGDKYFCFNAESQGFYKENIAGGVLEHTTARSFDSSEFTSSPSLYLCPYYDHPTQGKVYIGEYLRQELHYYGFSGGAAGTCNLSNFNYHLTYDTLAFDKLQCFSTMMAPTQTFLYLSSYYPNGRIYVIKTTSGTYAALQTVGTDGSLPTSVNYTVYGANGEVAGSGSINLSNTSSEQDLDGDGKRDFNIKNSYIESINTTDGAYGTEACVQDILNSIFSLSGFTLYNAIDFNTISCQDKAGSLITSNPSSSNNIFTTTAGSVVIIDRPALPGSSGMYKIKLLLSTTLSDCDNTWASKDSSASWSGLAMSSDGSKLFAMYDRGGASQKVRVSTDSGSSWFDSIEVLPSTNNWKVASSASGVYVFVAPSSGGGNAYKSTNSGQNFSITTALSIAYTYNSIAISSNGQTLLEAQNSGSIPLRLSTDGGTNLFNVGSSLSWQAVALASGNNNLALAAAGSNYVYLSTDAGLNWSPKITISAPWITVALSADGSKQVAVATNGHVFISSNSGQTWSGNKSPVNKAWSAAAISGSGDLLVLTASASAPYLYTSDNLGDSWIALDATSSGLNFPIHTVALSNDGSTIVSAGSSSYVKISPRTCKISDVNWSGVGYGNATNFTLDVASGKYLQVDPTNGVSITSSSNGNTFLELLNNPFRLRIREGVKYIKYP
ncbi:MAG: hypothetical protein HQK52_18415 [Oligoflexia bacterium]|nr:hypothetical protein [Oligoflexia bacterium]